MTVDEGKQLLIKRELTGAEYDQLLDEIAAGLLLREYFIDELRSDYTRNTKEFILRMPSTLHDTLAEEIGRNIYKQLEQIIERRVSGIIVAATAVAKEVTPWEVAKVKLNQILSLENDVYAGPSEDRICTRHVDRLLSWKGTEDKELVVTSQRYEKCRFAPLDGTWRYDDHGVVFPRNFTPTEADLKFPSSACHPQGLFREPQLACESVKADNRDGKGRNETGSNDGVDLSRSGRLSGSSGQTQPGPSPNENVSSDSLTLAPGDSVNEDRHRDDDEHEYDDNNEDKEQSEQQSEQQGEESGEDEENEEQGPQAPNKEAESSRVSPASSVVDSNSYGSLPERTIESSNSSVSGGEHTSKVVETIGSSAGPGSTPDQKYSIIRKI
ncbi:hypothetical protein K469DRAFT_755124 [Zopfia rhizophila CBS 207.26]|uniref:Uncharacterized protein n=1 Tax=Zopfia rhizophila CBS 207.26 TaxID=1314779 RepID=A0A6A6DEC2_9PEZI|nr:hypothetical protein K469DRAFT_755124 [Zopfia rhizophila CBS 207.26]